jgi:hypothetical protein
MSAVMSPMFQSPGELPPEAPRRFSPGAVVAVAAGVLLFGLAIWGVRHLISDSKPPARQVARISVLPDTPPPPPPPKVEKKEEPKPESKPQPQAEQTPKPVAPAAPEPLKMEGAAGNGPSAFAAGTVTKDYAGGPAVSGPGGGTAVDRAAERLYANSVRQLLRDELERQLAPEAGDVSAQLALWIAADGRITRWEWSDAGDHETELQGAMQRVAASMRLPAPSVASLALRFRLSLRSAT